MPNGKRRQYLKAGWVILAMAVLAIAIPIVATAAQPHVLWLFSTSYGAIGLVVGATFIRVATRRGRRIATCPQQHTLEGCR